MKISIACAAGLLAISGLPVMAATPVTYVFRGFIEYGRSPGTAPPPGTKLGTFTKVTVVVDSSALATVTANTATYSGGYSCGAPTPIISVSIPAMPGMNFGNGNCDTIVITENASGVSSISMSSAHELEGQTFAASFTTTTGNGITSLAIPTKIDTTQFERSLFLVADPAWAISGDMTTR